ncbi:hypothetical protein FACS1894207_1700 [Bacteroidia bacterium]|nr:hypothetical protein FACS1894207_1700 [Bacteroidia bacterium]
MTKISCLLLLAAILLFVLMMELGNKHLSHALAVFVLTGIIVFLLAIAKDEKSYKDIGNGDFYIQYEQSFADESAEYKNLLEYYLSHKSKISVLK